MKTANSQSVKIANTQLVIEKLIEQRETTRVDLSRVTTLNKATVSTIVEELIAKNLVVELNKKIKTTGRSANAIALNKNAGRILSVDLQTNLIYGVISNLYGEIVYEVHQPTEHSEFEPYLNALIKIIDDLTSNTYDSIYGIIGIGIGVYGILDHAKKIVYTPFSSWKDIDLKSIIEEYTGIKTYVENEANISALGESIGHDDQTSLISLNIGLGVGMGIIIDGSLYTGENGFAGEIGHTIIVPNGRSCVCGNKGCLERYISNDAILNEYQERFRKSIDMNDYLYLLKQKDPDAIEIYRYFIDHVAIAVNNISQMYNPKTIIINSDIINTIPESISLIKQRQNSKIMQLDVLATSTYQSKTNVLGLAYVLIQNFLTADSL